MLQIESEFALVKVHRRSAEGTWTEEIIEQFDAAIEIPSLATTLTLSEIYDTLDVRPRTRLQVVRDAPKP